MKRRKKGGGANWMDTYGDMVTLLLCFFVLLFSMSTISQENLKALVMSFNPKALETITATSGDDGPNADPNTEDGSGLAVAEIDISQDEVDAELEALYQALQAYIAQEGVQSSISITRGDGKVFVSFNQAVFFDGNVPTLRKDATPVLDSVSGMLTQAVDAIAEVRVLGHTAQESGDAPNDPVVDRVLSAQRAANVVAYIQTHSTVDPAKMISEGYGQWRPVADNATPEGRAQNRRVEMIVSGRNIEAELADAVQQYSA